MFFNKTANIDGDGDYHGEGEYDCYRDYDEV
jgi:hypothetical protein